MLYVLDEPSIGLHPSNIVGLNGVIRDLVADGNSVLLVDHDTQILKEADWLIEMGPGAGAAGGRVIAEGSVADVGNNPESRIGGFLSGRADTRIRRPAGAEEMFSEGRIRLSTSGIHTVKPLEVEIPKGRLTVVTGVSGSGKTTLVLESLVPALKALAGGTRLPAHVRVVEAEGIGHVKAIDATPIGVNVRSTVATYANVHDELRKIYAKTPDAKSRGYKAEDFSYNTGRLRCPACDGTGSISLDVQFLPDVVLTCPECRGSRYGKDAWLIKHTDRQGRALFVAGTDGHGYRRCIGGLCRHEGCVAAYAGVAAARFGLSDAGGGDARSLRRRGAAVEGGQRNGENAGGFRVRFRRTDHRAASAGCAGIAGRFPGLD